jgi:exopolyphosphatase / guanosine-5'-triphosphate,3'-diphosphate pyrophosphatase
VTELDLAQRLKLDGLDPRRADLVVAGAVLVDSLLKKLGAKETTLCDLALREGLVLDYIEQHRTEIARVDRYPDVRRRSTIELAERSQWEADHSRQVARLALSLFDQTREFHSLGDREREWLEFAALLHDVGMHISYERHHLHSYYLIKNGDLRGFEPEEIDVIALVARYHRRGTPKRKHDTYADLSGSLRRTIRILSAFLRLAESLDRSRNGVVKSVEVHTQADGLTLDVHAVGDSELEVWAAIRQLPVLSEELDQSMQIAAHHVKEADGMAAAKKIATKKTAAKKTAKRRRRAPGQRSSPANGKRETHVSVVTEPDGTS